MYNNSFNMKCNDFYLFTEDFYISVVKCDNKCCYKNFNILSNYLDKFLAKKISDKKNL